MRTTPLLQGATSVASARPGSKEMAAIAGRQVSKYDFDVIFDSMASQFVILVLHKVTCPDDKKCFGGVDCYLANKVTNATDVEVVCGDCPEGYFGDGTECKPKCHKLKCKTDTEYCSAPDTCIGMNVYWVILIVK